MKIGIITILFFTSFIAVTQSDDSIGVKQYSVVEYDLYNGIVEDFLPFDVPFYLRGPVAPSVSKIELFYVEKRKSQASLILNSGGTNDSYILNALNNDSTLKVESHFSSIKDNEWGYSCWTKSPKVLRLATVGNDTFNILVEPLRPNREYLFFIRISYYLDGVAGTKIIQLFKEFSSQKVREKVYDETKKSIEDIPLTDTLGLSNFQNKIDENFKKLLPFTEENFISSKTDSLVVTQVGSLLMQQYGIHVNEKLLQKALNHTFGVQEKKELYNLHLELYRAQQALIRQKVFYLSNDTILITENLSKFGNDALMAKYNALNELRESYITNYDYNVGYFNFSEYVELPQVEEITNSDQIKELIKNVKTLRSSIKLLKNELSQAISNARIVQICDPAFDKAYQSKLKSINDTIVKIKAKEKPTDEEKQKLITLENESKILQSAYNEKKLGLTQGLKLSLSNYDDYDNLLKNRSLSGLFTINRIQSQIDTFWLNKMRSAYFYIETESKLSSAFQNSTTNSFMTRAEYYISGDIGLAAMCFGEVGSGNFGVKTIQPYFGVNFNLFPVNRQAHYNLLGRRVRSKYEGYRAYRYTYVNKVFRGSSIVVGLTWRNIGVDIYDDNDLIQPLWKSTQTILMTGYAVRLSDYVRLTLGTSWYRYRSSYNPLDNQSYKLGCSFYFGLSADLNVKKYLGLLGDAITGGIPK